MKMDFEAFRGIVRQALAEDLGAGDITTQALIPTGEQARARIIAKQDLTVAGLPLAEMVFRELDPAVSCTPLVAEGARAAAGDALMLIEGEARTILAGERTALNFLQHLCGIATLAARFRDRLGDGKTVILDTRKTIPGLRRLQKYAVSAGGGTNHRFGLYDAVLVKDNHLKILARRGPGKIRRAVAICRERCPGKEIEIEVTNLEELKDALRAGADIILLDNFSAEDQAEAVALSSRKVRLEASGGINLETVAAVAETGVDRVSLGCLTHSAPAVDISLEIEPESVE